MSDIDSFFLQTNLHELDSPNKLSRYFLNLKHYKSSIIGDNNSNNKSTHIRNDSCSLSDRIVTNQLSEFIYQQRLNGKFFLSNFTKDDFQNMMDIITDEISFNESKSDNDQHSNNYDWIWTALQNDINNSRHKPVIESKMDVPETLNWIVSPFNKYEILLNNKYTNTKQKEAMNCNCISVDKCKALKRLIMVLHFYQSLIDEIDKNNNLLIQYFKDNDNIYTDYEHIRDKYIIGSSQIDVNRKNIQIIKDTIKTYIKCDKNVCISYKRKDNKFLKECIYKMDNGSINENNMIEFCSKIMDIIHCFFVHDISFKNTNVKKSNNSIKELEKKNSKANKQIKIKQNEKKAKKEDTKNESFGCFSILCL